MMSEINSNVTSLNALRTWKAIPQPFRDKLVRNVFCGNCKGAVEIIQYNIVENNYGLILEGKCRACGGSVARVVEKE